MNNLINFFKCFQMKIDQFLLFLSAALKTVNMPFNLPVHKNKHTDNSFFIII